MIRLAFFAGLLGLLAAVPAPAHPTTDGWRFWFAKPERHGQRKLAGDYTHHYGTYRNHSRPDGGGLFSFLHGNGRATARHKGPLHPPKSSRQRTSGLF